MFRWLHRKRPPDREIDDELRYHLAMLARERREAGDTPVEAARSARRKLGNQTLIEEEMRWAWGWRKLETLWQDLRYAQRMLRKDKGFTITAVLSLALGIGANTAIFSLIDALLLRMLPVPNPQQLVEVMVNEAGHQVDSFAYPAIQALAQQTRAFTGLCGFSGAAFNVAIPGIVERTSGAWVSGEFYRTLEVVPALGRMLAPEDDRPGGGAAGPVAVISYGYWERKFGRNPNVIGQSVRVEASPVTIVGVSPPGFDGANVGQVADITLPFAALPQVLPERAQMLGPNFEWIRVLARLRPGVSSAQAKAQLAVLWPQIARTLVTAKMPPPRRKAILDSTLDLIPGGTGWSNLRRQFTRPLLVLMALVALVLLIACANVANLLLTRAAARHKEIAVRLAIGAGRPRLIRQMLTENVMLSGLGAAVGVFFAFVSSRALVALLSTGQRGAILLDLRPDALVLLFTSASAMATGILFGLAPAFRATASGPIAALKEDTHSCGRPRGRLASGLVISQIALSMMLLIGAGLFVRTLRNLETLDPGFRHEGVLLVNIDPRRAGYKDERLVGLYQDLLQRLNSIHGVKSASLSANTPLSGGIWSDGVLVEGQPPKGIAKAGAHFNGVAPKYFATLDTPFLLGRDFDLRDGVNTTRVAIVNETFVKDYLEGAPALGRHVSAEYSPDLQDMEIVGMVKDAVSFSLREPPPPEVFVPYFQNLKYAGIATIEIRAQGSIFQVSQSVREAIHNRLPDAPFRMLTFTKQVEQALVQERLVATLAMFFGLLALGLAAVGLYGLMAYSVTRRTGEIGIRMALGAERRAVVWLVLRDALALVALGIVLGLPAALAASTLVSKMLFGLTPTDPLTAAAAITVLMLVAFAAAILPATKASKVDPMVALRYE